MRAPAILGLLAALFAVLFPASANAQKLRVVIVPGLEVADLRAIERRGAVGLLVPGAGPETSAGSARAALERGAVRNSLRGGLPSGPVLIMVETGRVPQAGPAIVLALPRGGEQPNDRRYPMAVLGPGHRGLLTSESTRIPGLVSIADVAPTALGRAGALGSKPEARATDALERLDDRIDRNNDARKTLLRLVAALVLVLALVAPRAAILGVALVLIVNLALGAVTVGSEWLLIAATGLAVLAGAAVARVIRSPAAVAVVLTGTLAAYLLAFLADERWVALSPLGPTQNARFYGFSNLIATLLLVPALVGGALLARRRLVLLAPVAILAFIVVAGSRFGADGGGAVVLAVGFAVLAAALAGLRRRALALVVGAALALAVAAIALEAALGASSHVTRALEGGPGGLADDLRDRVELSFARATAHWQNAAIVVVCVGALTLLAARLLRSPRPLADRALPLAFLAAIATSLVVNDSPVEVAMTGLACYVAVETYALGAAGTSPADRLRLTTTQRPASE
jgi:hypothetical protein